MSKRSTRKFQKAREQHYAELRRDEAERKEARLKGFKPVTAGEMTTALLDLPPNILPDREIKLARRLRQGKT